MPINAEWHAGNPMPAKASFEQRLEWHLAHAVACGCRPIPTPIRAEAEMRGLLAPEARTRKRVG